MTILRNCRHCGQPLHGQRLGVYLPPLKAAIFDAIHAGGDLGASTEDLQQLAIWADRRTQKLPAAVTIRAHIWQINEFLAETDWRVRQINRDRRYVLIHTPQVEARAHGLRG